MPDPFTFADVDDVTTRIARTLSSEEEAMVQQLLELVAGELLEALSRDLTWAEGLDEIPATLKAISIEKAVTITINPRLLQSTTETLGAYTYTERHSDGGPDAEPAPPSLLLSDDEKRRARRAVFGRGTGSSKSDTLLEKAFGPEFETIIVNGPDPDWPEDWPEE